MLKSLRFLLSLAMLSAPAAQADVANDDRELLDSVMLHIPLGPSVWRRSFDHPIQANLLILSITGRQCPKPPHTTVYVNHCRNRVCWVRSEYRGDGRYFNGGQRIYGVRMEFLQPWYHLEACEIRIYTGDGGWTSRHDVVQKATVLSLSAISLDKAVEDHDEYRIMRPALDHFRTATAAFRDLVREGGTYRQALNAMEELDDAYVTLRHKYRSVRSDTRAAEVDSAYRDVELDFNRLVSAMDWRYRINGSAARRRHVRAANRSNFSYPSVDRLGQSAL